MKKSFTFCIVFVVCMLIFLPKESTFAKDKNNVQDVTVLNNENNPVPVTIQNGGPQSAESMVYRFVGFSSGTITGKAGGPGGMHAKCQETFGSAARMCTTEEWWKSPGLSTAINGMGWIQPVITTTYVDGADPKYIDFTGQAFYVYNGDCTTCYGWKNDTTDYAGIRLEINSDLQLLNIGGCYVNISVTCCAPAE